MNFFLFFSRTFSLLLCDRIDNSGFMYTVYSTIYFAPVKTENRMQLNKLNGARSYSERQNFQY